MMNDEDTECLRAYIPRWMAEAKFRALLQRGGERTVDRQGIENEIRREIEADDVMDRFRLQTLFEMWRRG